MRNTAYRVHQNKITVCAHFCTISRRSEIFHNLICCFLIIFAGNVCTQLVQSRCRTCSSRNVTGFVRNIGSIKVPIRYKVFRQVRIIEDKVINLFSHIKILLIVGITVTHGVSVNGPCLSACPGGFVSIPLCSLFLTYLTGYGIIIHYVITAVIGTEMVLHGGIGMLHGNIIISGIA